MKIMIPTILVLTFISFFASAQQSYTLLIAQADSLYRTKDYKLANEKYISALKIEHRDKNVLYNAACVAALAGEEKNAFKFLNLSIDRGWYNLEHAKKDSDLNSLHNSEQWTKALNKMKLQLDKIEANYNKEAKLSLEKVYETDQGIRLEYISAQKNDGFNSKRVDSLVKLMNHHDSLNTAIITQILNKYGWLGEDMVGNKGNLTLFLVIQHAKLKIQQKYLPMLRAAVKKGNARGSSLALLEDRVALREGKKQIYGSQMSSVPDHPEKYYLSPLIDPDNVDKRRVAVGLQPIAEYIKQWNIVWNVDDYKKQLPQYEEWEKRIKW